MQLGGGWWVADLWTAAGEPAGVVGARSDAGAVLFEGLDEGIETELPGAGCDGVQEGLGQDPMLSLRLENPPC